jgi:hypothetical protein
MGAPALATQYNGVGAVSADNYNTFVQSCNVPNDLRAFAGGTGQQVYMRGYVSPGDGGQGNFYWNATSTNADDNGATTIAPVFSLVGRWIRLATIATLTGTNLPTSNPGVGSGLLWNNAGIVCVA